MRLLLLFISLLIFNSSICQNLPPFSPWENYDKPSDPLDLVAFLKLSFEEGGPSISSEEIEYEINFDTNNESKKVKYKSLDSVNTYLHKKFTGSINIPDLGISYSYKNGLLHGKWEHEDIILGGQFVTGEFIDGKPHGVWFKHNMDEGDISIQYTFDHGSLRSICRYNFD